jgi:hypothetical protein
MVGVVLLRNTGWASMLTRIVNNRRSRAVAGQFRCIVARQANRLHCIALQTVALHCNATQTVALHATVQ